MTHAADTEARPEAEPRIGRVAVVLNGRAGALLGRPGASAELAEHFASVGLEPDFVPVDAGTLPERVRLAVGSGVEIIVVAGGDGTIACAAQAIVGTGATLGILPFGTMNLLAKDLGIPVDDISAAIAVIATGAARNIDVGEVGGRAFLCASMLGLPAALGRHREAHRVGGPALLRWARFARAALRTTRRYVARRMVLEFAGDAIVSKAPSITVTVNRLDESGGRLFGRTCLDGGEFAIYLAQRPRLREIPALVRDLLRGSWHAGGAIEEKRSERLVVRTRRRAIRVMNDGEEMVLPTPLEYRLRPGALRVIAPASGR